MWEARAQCWEATAGEATSEWIPWCHRRAQLCQRACPSGWWHRSRWFCLVREQRCRRSPLRSQTNPSSLSPSPPRSLRSAKRSQQRKQVAHEQATLWGMGYGGASIRGKCTVYMGTRECSWPLAPSLGLEKERETARVSTLQMRAQNRAAVGLCRSEQSYLTGCFIQSSRPLRLNKNWQERSHARDIQWGRRPMSRVMRKVLAAESNLNLNPSSTACWLWDLYPSWTSVSLSVRCR